MPVTKNTAPVTKGAVTKNTAPTAESVANETATTRESGIVVRDPLIFKPKTLPLVVILPEGASKAQIHMAKVLNGFAYQFPDKWAARKEECLAELESLKDAPDPVEDPNVRLTVGAKVPPGLDQ